MTGSLTICHVRGIPIRAHFTLLFILPYLAFLMATRFAVVAQRAGVDGSSVLFPPVVWGLLLAVLLFGCVLLHELGHALVAMREGGSVSSITLMLLGGVSQLHGLPKSPRAEGIVAIAGPIVSAVIGGLALGVYALVPGPADVRFGLFYLGQINLVLAAFNILPAFPMDGGRVLRALLSIHWSRETATRIAALAGACFAALFLVGGFVTGNIVLMLIGLFVWTGAQAETRAVTSEAQIQGLTVRDVMSPTSATVQPWQSVAQAADIMAHSHSTTLPVVVEDRLLGVIAAHHIEAMTPEERERTPTAAITARDVPRLHAGELLSTALERMAEQRSTEAPVLEEGHVIGILEASELGRAMRLHRMAMHADHPPARAPIVSDLPDIGDHAGE